MRGAYSPEEMKEIDIKKREERVEGHKWYRWAILVTLGLLATLIAPRIEKSYGARILLALCLSTTTVVLLGKIRELRNSGIGNFDPQRILGWGDDMFLLTMIYSIVYVLVF